jgi:hypothetical protein
MSDLVLLKSLLAKLETHESGYKYTPEHYNIPTITQWIKEMEGRGQKVFKTREIGVEYGRMINKDINKIVDCLLDENFYSQVEDKNLCTTLRSTQANISSKNEISLGDLGLLFKAKKHLIIMENVVGSENKKIKDTHTCLDALIGKIKSVLTEPR